MSDVVTGELLPEPCSADEARRLTDQIKQTAERLWALLLEAHERRAWAALGYERWEDYVRSEFDMSRQQSYRLLDQGRVIREIGAVSPMGDIAVSEREARDLKPVLPQVVQEVRERVADLGPQPEPDRVQQTVRHVVQETREARRTPVPPHSEARANREARFAQVIRNSARPLRAVPPRSEAQLVPVPADTQLDRELDERMAATDARFRSEFSRVQGQAAGMFEFAVHRLAEVHAAPAERTRMLQWLGRVRGWCDEVEAALNDTAKLRSIGGAS
jgi:hypothetical protein